MLITSHKTEPEYGHSFSAVASIDYWTRSLNILKVSVDVFVHLLRVVCNFVYAYMINEVGFLLCKTAYAMLH